MQLHGDGTVEESRQTAAAEDGVVRALSLAHALLNRPGGLTREQIFDKVELYRARRDERDRLTGGERQRADAALEKLFGHDKEHLRSCGIELREPSSDDDYRYRISRSHYGLPDLQLTGPERLALYRAQLLFADSTVAGLHHAVWAIDSDSEGTPDPGGPSALRASLGSEAEISQLLQFSTAGMRRPVSFGYTGRGRHHTETRRVVPLGLGVRGHWYVVGHDLDRDAQRVFRLDRVSGAVTKIPQAALNQEETAAVHQIAQRQRYGAVDVSAELDRTGEGFSAQHAWAGALLAHQGPVPKSLPKLTAPPAGHRRDDGASKTERVINMIALLLSSDGVRPSELIAQYGVTAEQLLRDLLSISLVTAGEFPDTLDVHPFPPLNDDEFAADYLAADQPITLGSGGGSLARPVSLTKPGALSLLIALRSLIDLSPVGDEHVAEAAESLRLKVMSVAPEPIAQAAESMSLAQRVGDRSLVVTAQQAISSRYALSLVYTDVSGQRTKRVTEPVQLVYQGPHIYIRAWCRHARGERYFRLDRIGDVTALPNDPHGEASAALSLSEAGGPEVPFTDHSVPVVLRFAPSAAGQAVLYHPLKQHTDKATGARTVSTRFVSREAAVRLCVEAGGDLELIRPVELRGEIAERARHLLETHQK